LGRHPLVSYDVLRRLDTLPESRTVGVMRIRETDFRE
jgi:hypothetical protein